MIYEQISIDIDYNKLGIEEMLNATMTIYMPDNYKIVDSKRKRPTVIICPGGGYANLSEREAEPIALKLIAEDCNAIVLRYSVAPAKFPVALLELSYTVAKLRKNANIWNVDVNKIVICGFSAGGHLAASFSTLWNKEFVKSFFGYTEGENRPNGMILGCPVITSGKYMHEGSFCNLLGENPSELLMELVTVEKQVDKDTPPAFIWHTFTDMTVNVKNSLILAETLIDNNIETELHIFPNGPHGLSLANSTVYKDYDGKYDECQCWINMAIRWLKSLQ